MSNKTQLTFSQAVTLSNYANLVYVAIVTCSTIIDQPIIQPNIVFFVGLL